VVGKVVLVQVISEYFGFPAISHYTNSFSVVIVVIIIIIRGLHNRLDKGWCTKWTQSRSIVRVKGNGTVLT
jgi:hypothetical protein